MLTVEGKDDKIIGKMISCLIIIINKGVEL